MTKEITKAIVLQEMQDKFKLREFEPAKFLFNETVVPVYNIEAHLETWMVAESTVSITSATSFVFFTVPQNERWLLRAYALIFGATGAIKASGLLVYRTTAPTIAMYLDLTKGQEISYLRTMETTVPLNAGDTLRVLIDTYVSTQDLRVRIDYMKEEIR